jgi:hypothetical protein
MYGSSCDGASPRDAEADGASSDDDDVRSGCHREPV